MDTTMDGGIRGMRERERETETGNGREEDGVSGRWKFRRCRKVVVGVSSQTGR